jgi:hypothetical protein
MLYQTYVQALDIINNDEPALNHVFTTMNITMGQIETWEVEEVQYIAELGHEPEGDVHAMAYIKLLQELCAAE